MEGVREPMKEFFEIKSNLLGDHGGLPRHLTLIGIV